MEKSSLYQELLARLDNQLVFLRDKPEETARTTLAALWCAAAGKPVSVERAAAQPLEALDSEHKQIHIEELINFYSSPARAFLQKRFAIQTYDQSLLLPIREPFSLQRFDDTKIRQQLLTVFKHAASDEQVQAAEIEQKLKLSRAKGLLPYGDIGDNDFARQSQIMHAFIQKIPDQHQQADAEKKLPFSLAINDFELSGTLEHLNDIKQRILIQPAQPYGKT